MTDDLTPIDEGDTIVPPEPDNPNSYGGDPAAPTAPNSFYWPFGTPAAGHRRAYISWQSDSPIAVLAFVIFLLILVGMAVLAVIGAIFEYGVGHPSVWMADTMKVLGQALLTVVGAIVGASAQGVSSKQNHRK